MFNTFSYCSTAQVNPQMPRTFGDALIHMGQLDYAVKVDVPLPEHGGGKLTEADIKIANLIAGELVQDGATLQMGKKIKNLKGSRLYPFSI